jgi:hypothetical protein
MLVTIGEENKVMRIDYVFSLILTAVTSVFVLIFLGIRGY